MHLDVQDLRNFYYRSALGRAAQKVVRDQLLAFWPESGSRGQTVVGFGFAVPLLRPYLGSARRVVALMPGPQGVMAWPPGMPNVSVLCDETRWPLPTGLVDRLVLLHGFEMSDDPSALLEECWRVLGPGGRAILIVPNRTGVWARSDRTPFGHGRPFTPGQLEAQLKRHGFAIERSLSTLYQPPSVRPVWRRLSALLEAAGRHLPVFKAGGVVMVEVSKQVLSPRRGDPVSLRARLPVLVPLPRPTARAPGAAPARQAHDPAP
ncbi:MAG: methyltransferase domain-containing protein [Rubellimicrobium sp.]|nr:methyltransferase domain-containing protein [Rubellimicrobium sp.]